MKPVPQGPQEGNAPQAARTRRIEAVVLSSDDGLIIDLGPVLGDRYRTRPLDTAEALIGHPPEGQWFVLLDTVQRSDARAVASQLESQFPAAPIIAIVASGEEAQWASMLARGVVIAAVGRDGTGGAALRDALQAVESRLAAQSAPTISLARPPGGGGLPRFALPAAALLLLVAAGAGWYLWHGQGSGPTNPPSVATGGAGARANGPAVAAADHAQSALELLSAARVAFAGQKQLPRPDAEPKGDSALELYVQALAFDPKNEEARDGVRRLFNLARTRMQSDLAAGRFDDTARLLELFHKAGMESEATAGIEAEIASARPRWLATQVRDTIASGDVAAAEQALAQLATSGADPAVLQDLQKALEAKRQDAQLGELAGGVRAALAAGNLLEPLADNARTRLQAMRQVNRTHPVTLAAQHDYAAALLARATEASHGQQFDAAQRYIAAAADVATPTEIADARRQVQADVDLAAQRAAAATTAAPASGNAAPPARPSILNARTTRPLSVTYPAQALADKVTGYVVVEFTLQGDGRARDISVVESQPAGVFDQAAIDGVARGRFDVAALGPDHKPQRARIRVSFK